MPGLKQAWSISPAYGSRPSRKSARISRTVLARCRQNGERWDRPPAAILREYRTASADLRPSVAGGCRSASYDPHWSSRSREPARRSASTRESCRPCLQPARPLLRARARNGIEQPFQLRCQEIAIEQQTSSGLHHRLDPACPQRYKNVRRTPILPHDCIVDRCAHRPVPDDARLPLIRDADGSRWVATDYLAQH